MEFISDLLYKVDYTNLPFVLTRIAVFLLFSAVIIWILWAILSKTMYKKNEKLPKEYKLKLAFVWALIWYYVIFSFYLFFFFKRNGIDSFQWGNPKFYLEISSHLISIIASIVLYLFKQFQLAKELK
jgi:hypothetical protein